MTGESSGPLQGVRVVDLSLLLPGPLCSQHLADMGAEVIKIENPRMGDMTRHWGGKIEGTENSAMFSLLNRKKKSVTINIKREAGREVLLKLLATSDILLEGFRPGTMSELEIGWPQLQKKFPRLIYCAISGYGATGPDKDMAGHDGNFAARAGLLGLNGPKNAAPVIPGFQVADIGGGTLVALSGILAALYAREKTGIGQFVDISMMDGAMAFLHLYAAEYIANGKKPLRGHEMLNGKLPNYNIYETKDNRFVILAALEERFFRTFLKTIDRSDLLEKTPLNEENLSTIHHQMIQIFKSKTLQEWKPWFEHTDCCLSPVAELDEVFEDRQLKARGMVTLQKSKTGKDFLSIGSPFVFSETPVNIHGSVPDLGENTRELLSELGYSEAELADLKEKRAI